ncbi:MAG TPA: hypothetical protein VJZ26_04980 [Blastocatellia bacterium]|nr:hypothetical protein [Blastocatellia bacterium]
MIRLTKANFLRIKEQNSNPNAISDKMLKIGETLEGQERLRPIGGHLN